MENTKKVRVVSREEMALQDEYCLKIQTQNARITAESGRRPLAFVDTYGCQQNVADSQSLRGLLDVMGYGIADSEKDADLIIINTCAVREHAEKRVFGNIGALCHKKRREPNCIIAVCGCMVQQPHIADKIKKSFRHVDIVFGPQALWRFPELLWRKFVEKKRVFEISDTEGRIAEDIPISRDNRIKAWVSIMYGCNNFCTYCIVPYVRGRERSRDAKCILSDIRQLIKDGYREINLLGQNVNSYGKDLEDGIRFPELLRQIDSLDGEFTVRFMTSHPKDATNELIDVIAESRHIAHQLHLPVQSGSDRILKMMNRHYDKKTYLDLIDYAKNKIPDLTLSSDIIVGFPGETNEDFEETLSLIKTVKYSAIFSFIYSKRSGTPAAEMDDPTSDEEKQARFERLLEVQNDIARNLQKSYVGRTMRVLVDGESDFDEYSLSAHTDGGRLVHLNGSSDLYGKYVNVKITDYTTGSLFSQLES